MSAFTLLYDSGPLAAPASSITATVDTSYRKFRVTLYGIKDGTGGAAYIRLNGDSGANYARQNITADASAATSSRSTGQTFFVFTQGDIAANTATLMTAEIEKPLASLPARIQTAISEIVGSNILYAANGGSWSNTADLLSSITITTAAGNFAAGTRMVVEGASPTGAGGGSGDVTDNSVRLFLSGSPVGDDKASAATWASSEETVLYGSDGDTWGYTFSPANINASTFGVGVSADVTDGEASIREIALTVFYEIPGGSREATTIHAFGPGAGHPTNPTLFTGYGDDVVYYVLPRAHLRPEDDPEYRYQIEQEGELVGPFVAVGAKSFRKALNAGRLISARVNAGRPAYVDYDIDEAGDFETLLTAEQSGIASQGITSDVFYSRIRYRLRMSSADEDVSPVATGVALNTIVLPPRKRMWTMGLVVADGQVQVGGGALRVAKSQQERVLYKADQRIVNLYDRDGNTFRARILGVTAPLARPQQRSDALVYNVTAVEITDITPPGNLFVLDRDAIDGTRNLG